MSTHHHFSFVRPDWCSEPLVWLELQRLPDRADFDHSVIWQQKKKLITSELKRSLNVLAVKADRQHSNVVWDHLTLMSRSKQRSSKQTRNTHQNTIYPSWDKQLQGCGDLFFLFFSWSVSHKTWQHLEKDWTQVSTQICSIHNNVTH